jgi:hypothetical protein
MGAELQVPSKAYPTIQSALNAAVDGDVVVLAAGTYSEACVVDGKSISVRGAGVAATTWIAPPDQRCLWVRSGAANGVGVSDIHFTGFSMPYSAAAVDIESTGVHRVARCRFTNSGFFALEVFGAGSLVESCEFNGNLGQSLSMTTPPGAPLSVTQVVRCCRFEDNHDAIGGAAIEVYNTRLRIESCRFERNNFPDGNGLAIRVGSSEVTIADSVFCESSSVPIAGAWINGGENSFSSDPCPSDCPGDLVADGIVNGADASVLLNFWATDGCGYPGVDLDGDGIVGAADITVLLNSWGACAN